MAISRKVNFFKFQCSKKKLSDFFWPYWMQIKSYTDNEQIFDIFCNFLNTMNIFSHFSHFGYFHHFGRNRCSAHPNTSSSLSHQILAFRAYQPIFSQPFTKNGNFLPFLGLKWPKIHFGHIVLFMWSQIKF